MRCRVQSKLVAGLLRQPRIKRVTRARERNTRSPALTMNRDLAMTLVARRMLVGIDAAPVLNQPFSECCDFHGSLLSSSIEHLDHDMTPSGL